MSGGVDSSTCAALLTQKYGASDIKGIYMQNWSPESKCQERNWNSVVDVCKKLGIDCLRVDFQKEYWNNVFEPMLLAYQNGKTPNPDVNCNYFIKFGKLIDHLKMIDPAFKYIASGHYAGIDSTTKLIKRANYLKKDQSYYLATVPFEQRKHIILPLANFTKPEVREMALKFKLGEVASKPDSQGLCFVEQQSEVGHHFSNFLKDYLIEKEGPFVLASDRTKVVGKHIGLWSYTIGQRASVQMPQHLPEYKGQWYVVQKDYKNNALVIDRGKDSPLLLANKVHTKNFIWHQKPKGKITAQFRSLQLPWEVSHFEDNIFTFKEKRSSIAPGQYLVVYENNFVIGCGEIIKAECI